VNLGIKPDITSLCRSPEGLPGLWLPAGVGDWRLRPALAGCSQGQVTVQGRDWSSISATLCSRVDRGLVDLEATRASPFASLIAHRLRMFRLTASTMSALKAASGTFSPS
jgi:hypothetical protein